MAALPPWLVAVEDGQETVEAAGLEGSAMPHHAAKRTGKT
jgi:hypothetical protein